MAPKIEKVTEGSIIGEAPHWDVASQSLYFIDFIGKTLNRYDPATKNHTKVNIERSPSIIIPVEGKKDQFVISQDKELHKISWDGVNDKIIPIEKIATVDNERPETEKNVFNDGKCDSLGRLWAGTHQIDVKAIAETKPLGTLYSFGPNKEVKNHLSKIFVANGLGWDDKTKKMFYIDSLTKKVDRYDFDLKSGTLSNGETLFSLEKNGIEGIPDGLTVDTDGNLWVCVFGGKNVLKIDGKKQETLLEKIELPAVQVTSAAWGGKNLDELYITTASLNLTGSENGATYRITGTGSRGLPANSYKLI